MRFNMKYRWDLIRNTGLILSEIKVRFNMKYQVFERSINSSSRRFKYRCDSIWYTGKVYMKFIKDLIWNTGDI